MLESVERMTKIIKPKKIKKAILLNKKEGETPLEALEKFRSKNLEYKNIPMTYAGRLDPMASGALLVLAGEETKNKENYLALSKKYEFEVLFGFATDTYDILGKIISSPMSDIGEGRLKKEIQKNLKYFTGKFIQKYPAYSSKPVNGVSMFAHARAGTEVEIPEKEVFVLSFKLLKIRKIKKEKLLENIEKRISRVNGDFRQKEIIKIWKKELNGKKSASMFYTASFKIKCGSGTYVRGIANSLGEKIGVSALAFSIKRTKIGKFTLK